jgi:hypothetical protein
MPVAWMKVCSGSAKQVSLDARQVPADVSLILQGFIAQTGSPTQRTLLSSPILNQFCVVLPQSICWPSASFCGVRQMAKSRSAAKQSQSYLFNFAATGVGAVTILLAIFGSRSKEIITPCSERYGAATQFSLQRSNGELSSSAELQSRLGGRDWGVLENARVIKTPDGPAPLALQVNLPKSADPVTPYGMAFTWLIAEAKPVESVCFSYQVWMPPDFEFGEGGILPGVFGGETSDAPRAGKDIVKTSFGTHYVWNNEGLLSLRVASNDPDVLTTVSLGESPPRLALGRWMLLEQELALNTTDAEGLLRVWVDGKLMHENVAMNWRQSETAVFRGVDARAHFTHGGLLPARGPKATRMILSPIELRLQKNAAKS